MECTDRRRYHRKEENPNVSNRRDVVGRSEILTHCVHTAGIDLDIIPGECVRGCVRVRITIST